MNTRALPPGIAQEYKVMSLRECPLPESLAYCTSPEEALSYWQHHIANAPYFNPDCECFVVLMLNIRHRVKGHQMVSIGTMDTILVHPREIFRAAIIAGSAAIVLMHNHPSGEPNPSEGDVKTTQDVIRAGEILKIHVLDHVIVGHVRCTSLRDLGYFKENQKSEDDSVKKN